MTGGVVYKWEELFRLFDDFLKQFASARREVERTRAARDKEATRVARQEEAEVQIFVCEYISVKC